MYIYLFGKWFDFENVIVFVIVIVNVISQTEEDSALSSSTSITRLEPHTPQITGEWLLNYFYNKFHGNGWFKKNTMSVLNVERNLGQASDTALGIKKRRDFMADKSDHHVIIYFPYLDRVFVLIIPTLW